MTDKGSMDEFKAEAVKQITERGYPVAEVAERLGVSSHGLYTWLRERDVGRDARKAQKDVDLNEAPTFEDHSSMPLLACATRYP